MTQFDSEDLQELLNELASKHRVPGASLAILEDDGIRLAASGVVNKNTGVQTTTDTIFHIGSITKVHNATLVMQLVDEGQVDLDVPIKRYLPELKFADAQATESITLRQMLTHTSGLDGDFFEDTGRGDDSIDRYVQACRCLPQIAPPGALFSYCNAGFAVTGRLIEVLTGKTWDAALKDRLFDPLGLTETVTLPEDAILHRVAVGHVLDPSDAAGELVRTPFWH
ncbi:MAG: beta-lactamase family protein, partial [Actinobacteria bacterium]|nr:beta-lactamase family protein [Actinomycetota bacterium]